ncbi:MAG: MAPEG family protein [Halioglobus sp.]|nr:MAPEG family protein [Halioglobus sp.]
MEFIEPYRITVLVLGLSGIAFLVQLAIADIAAVKARHTPGFAIEQNHDSFLFRSHRAFANSNESASILILVSLFSIFSSADAAWLNGFAIVYLAGRIAHMTFYYCNLKVLRSSAFAIIFIALLGMFLVGALSWLEPQ